MTRTKGGLLATIIGTLLAGCGEMADDPGVEIRQSAVSYTQFLNSGQTLYAVTGDTLWDQSHTYRLVMGGDCNLVLYRGASPLWASGTANGVKTCRAVMGGDGNLVVYNGASPLWSTKTQGHPGAFLTLQGDRNLVVYTVVNGKLTSLWASNTKLDAPPPPPPPPPPPFSGCVAPSTQFHHCSFFVRYCTRSWFCPSGLYTEPGTFSCGVCL